MNNKKIYELLSKNPLCQSGLILPGSPADEPGTLLIEAVYSHPCDVAEKKIKSVEAIRYNLTSMAQLSISDACSTTVDTMAQSLTPVNESVKLSSYSPSRTCKFVLHEMGADKSTKRWITIWSSPSSRQASINVTEIHGSPYLDDTIGGIYWSQDEKFVVFIAEEYVKEPEDFEKYKMKSDWGERYSKKRRPVIAVVDIEAAQVKVLSNVPLDAAQVIFTRDENPRKLIFVGYQSHPRTYGLFACTNRPNGIYRIDLDGSNMEYLSKGFDCVRHPTLNPTRNELFFIATNQGGPHNPINKLYKMDLDTHVSECIIESVGEPADDASFPGLFIWDMLLNPWLDTNTLLLTSQWRFRTTILMIDVRHKTVQDITPVPKLTTWALVDIFSGYMLAKMSSLTCPPKLMLGIVDKDNTVSWRIVRSSIRANVKDDIFDWLESKVSVELVTLPAATRAEAQDYHPLEAVIVYPKEASAFGTAAASGQSKMPLIVCPHGGPHVAWCTEWYTTFSGMVARGYAVALINYTGSTGYGQRSITNLLGRIGELDVCQTHQVAEYLLSTKDWVDAHQIFAMGGSHGGFISAWLSAAYPKFYKAVILRNPVLDLLGNCFASDLPDWSYYETGLSYHFENPKFPTSKEMECMSRSSPSSKVAQVVCPTLLILGENDRRVVPLNGLRWHEALRGQGVDSRVYVMPGTGHAIEGVVNERENFAICLQFLAEQLATIKN